MASDRLTNYIKPNFNFANSYEKLIKQSANRNVFNKPTNFFLEEILEKKNVFILAEPGQGKSRLAKELAKILDERHVKWGLVELKSKHQNESIEQFVQRSQPDLKIDSDNAYVFLDGLDEVPQMNLLGTIEYLKSFIKDHPNLNVITTSRIHFFSKYQHTLSSIDATFVEIEHLTRFQAKDFLSSLDIPRPTIEKLFKDLNITYERVSVLQTPRYLEMLAQQVSDNPSIVSGLNRATLFESFVKGALREEDSKQGRQLVLHKIRFLEKLALSMEIAQLNVISEDDLVTFIDDAKSDVKTILLGQIGDIENLYEHSLLKKTGDDVSFTNAELQEYLAARSVLRLKDTSRSIFDLVIEPNLREPIPSWSNTLSYIIDEVPDVAIKLLALRSEAFKSQDESLHRLVTGSTSSKMAEQDKSKIFQDIWSYYINMKQMIRYELSLNLANYASTDQVSAMVADLKLLKNEPDSREDAVNIISIIGDMAKLERLNLIDHEAAIDKLIDMALTSDDNIMKHNAINSLTEFGDESVIEKLFALNSVEDQLVQGSLQHLAHELNKNSRKSIEIFVHGMKRNDIGQSRVGIEDVDEPEAISYFLEFLSKDADLVRKIINHNRIFVDEERKFLGHIHEYWKDEWLDLLKQFVKTAHTVDSGYYAARSDFVSNVIDLIAYKDPDYVRELLNYSITDKESHFMYSAGNDIVRLIKLSDVDFILDMAKKHDVEKYTFFDLLWNVAKSDNKDHEVIDRITKEEFADFYDFKEKNIAKWQKKANIDRRTLEFNGRVEKIGDGDKQVSFRNFTSALDMIVQDLTDESKNRQKVQYTSDQIDIIWVKAKTEVLDAFDPADVKVTINNKDDKGSRSYTITLYAHLFEMALQFGYLTKQPDMQNYREKMISAIPYAYYNDKKAILANLKTLTEFEKLKAIEAYADVDSDKAQYMPNNLVDIAREFNIAEAVPILDAFVDIKTIDDYVRLDALDVSEEIAPNKEKLQAIFKKYETKNKELALHANALLIKKYQDKDSILWLINYVRDNAFEYTSTANREFHTVGVFEHEIHDKDRIKPLQDIDDIEYVETFLSLLDYSFELVERGVTWHSYAGYIWSVVDQYFTNIVSKANHKAFTQLENHVSEYGDPQTTASFISHLNSIKRQYLDALGKEKPFSQSIRILNELNDNQNLMISSDKQLQELVIEVLENDLTLWVNGEGRKLLEQDEVPAQRNMSIILENFLLRRGFKNEEIRKNGIRLLRETQAEDDTRTDFLVYYGFFGPIVVELKQSSHGDLVGKDLTKKESYESLVKYMRQFSAKHGIFFVYERKERTEEAWQIHLKKIKESYNKIPGIIVVGINNTNRKKPALKAKKPATKKDK